MKTDLKIFTHGASNYGRPTVTYILATSCEQAAQIIQQDTALADEEFYIEGIEEYVFNGPEVLCVEPGRDDDDPLH